MTPTSTNKQLRLPQASGGSKTVARKSRDKKFTKWTSVAYLRMVITGITILWAPPKTHSRTAASTKRGRRLASPATTWSKVLINKSTERQIYLNFQTWSIRARILFRMRINSIRRMKRLKVIMGWILRTNQQRTFKNTRPRTMPINRIRG